MTCATTNLGGTASKVVVGKVGMETGTYPQRAIKAGIDALPPGAKTFLNGRGFYGHNLATTNLELIADFFATYPKYKGKAFLSIKGGLESGVSAEPDKAPNVSIYSNARVDPKVSVEETIAGYSPLGRGFLTGQIKRPEDIPEGDFRRHLPRFQEDPMRHSFAIVGALDDIAKKKNVTAAQLCIAWVSSLGPHVIPTPGSSHPKRTLKNCAGGNVEFTNAELEQINQVIEKLT